MPTIEQARTWYKEADPIHDFEHVLRVYRMAEKLGAIENADLTIVRTAVLLHDAEGALPHDVAARADHHKRSAIFAGQILEDEQWESERIEAVQHCIRAHRYRSTEAPETIEAQVVFDADKLDAIGAIGAIRTAGYALLYGNAVYAEPSQSFVDNFELAEGESHTAYHEFLFKLSRIKDRMYTTSGKQMAQARHEYLVEFFEQLGAEISGER